MVRLLLSTNCVSLAKPRWADEVSTTQMSDGCASLTNDFFGAKLGIFHAFGKCVSPTQCYEHTNGVCYYISWCSYWFQIELDEHIYIRVIKTKVAKNVSIMNRIKHCMINSDFFIVPSYCHIWATVVKFGVILIQVEYIYYARPILYQFKTLCLPDMVNFNSMVFMYKVFNNSLPNNLLVYFKKVYDCHQHNTMKNYVNFKIRFSRTTMKATHLCMKAPKNMEWTMQ